MEPTTAPDACPRCEYPRAWCICDRATPLATRTEVLILQHPGEQDRDLGSARLTTLMVPTARVRVGLSWASLKHALERDDAEHADWGVLWRASLPKPLTGEQAAAPCVVLTRKGEPRENAEPLKGLVVLDGTWSQAKALWWRNAWLLKLNRVVVNPREPSIYGKMRKEPNREALSTLEAVAEALACNGEDPATRDALRKAFRTLVQRARDAQNSPPPAD